MSEPTRTVLQMSPDRYDQLSTSLLGLRQVHQSIRGYVPAHLADRLESLIDQASAAVCVMDVMLESDRLYRDPPRDGSQNERHA
jgi:vacuolar-type H+-ATPase subunit I/STV1